MSEPVSQTKNKLKREIRNIKGVRDVHTKKETRSMARLRITLDAEPIGEGGSYSIENKKNVGRKLGGISNRKGIDTRYHHKPKKLGSGPFKMYDSNYYEVTYKFSQPEQRDKTRSTKGFSKGTFIYDSWGYNQTNVDFAKIVEVSDTGKTVVARRVPARKLKGGTKTDAKVMPKDEPYGDRFRLHVRRNNAGLFFKGSYPMSKNSDSTRKGTFMKWDKRSTGQTRPGMGH